MNERESTEQSGRRRGIQSVEIGLMILQTLAEMGGSSALSAIAAACDMAPPQVHRYLQSLMSAGMARQDPASGRYDLGPAALRLGLIALARIDAFRLVDGVIDAFCQRTGQTVQIAALGPLGPTIVRWYMGRPAVMTSFNVGSVLPLLHSATGRVFLAFAPESETADLLAREVGEGRATQDEAETICRDVRSAGSAHVRGTMIPGLRATAFPIFDLQGRPVLTATALRPESFTGNDDEALRELGELCTAISVQLGHRQTRGPSL